MPAIWSNLNLKDQRAIVVLNAPPSFEPELAALPAGVRVVRDAKGSEPIEFLLAFVTTQKEADTLGKLAARRASADAIVWAVYPKGTSKTLRSEINRDKGWDVLSAAGFQGVRMVAIDADWSALRFRRAEFVKSPARAAKRPDR